MRYGRAAIGLLLMVIVVIIACSPGVDKKKFDGARKTAQAVRQSLDNLDDYATFTKVFDAFANEVIALRDTASNEREQQLLRQYADLLMTYQDGLQLWEYKVESSQYSWVPEGRIYLEPKIKALALKYHLPVQAHMLELTQHTWKSIPADSLKIIWERARLQYGKLSS